MQAQPQAPDQYEQENIAQEHYVGREIKLRVPRVPFETETTMSRDYKRWEMEPPSQPKPNAPMPNKVPFTATTSNQADYPAWEIPERHSTPNAGAYRTSDVPFTGTSSYTLDYPQRELERREAVTPGRMLPKPIPFEGKTSYSADYPGHAVEPKQQTYPADPMHGYRPSSATMATETTNRADFKPWELPKQGAPTPSRMTPPNVPFAGTTTNQDDYKAWELPKREAQTPSGAPAKSVPFEGRSTYTDNYQPHPLEPKPATPSRGMAMPRPIPFDGTTSHKLDFQPYELEARAPPQATPVQPSPVRFEGTTENQDRYKAWPLEARPPMPTSKFSVPHVPFTATTTTGEAFKGWQLPEKRGSLGVETVGDMFHVLIARTVDTPASARAIFTTVHDNQSEVCILVLQGDDTVASKNRLLGRFDLVGIPPAPRDVPQIEVTFHLDTTNVLQVEAIDLDTGRHHEWKQSKGQIVVHD